MNYSSDPTATCVRKKSRKKPPKKNKKKENRTGAWEMYQPLETPDLCKKNIDGKRMSTVV